MNSRIRRCAVLGIVPDVSAYRKVPTFRVKQRQKISVFRRRGILLLQLLYLYNPIRRKVGLPQK